MRWFHEIIAKNGESKFLTVWENGKFTVTQEKFRQINSLVKTLLSRNFCQKSVTVNSRNFHTVMYLSLLFSWNYGRKWCSIIISFALFIILANLAHVVFMSGKGSENNRPRISCFIIWNITTKQKVANIFARWGPS